MTPPATSPVLEEADLSDLLFSEFKKVVDTKMDEISASISAQIEEKQLAASRAIRKARNAAIDDIDEFRYVVKKSPLQAVAVSCAIGFSLGIIIPLLFRRRSS